MIARRGFLAGLAAALAAPAIIRTPGLLMPVRPALVTPQEAYNAWASGHITYTQTMTRAEFDRTFVVFNEAAEISNQALLSLEDVQSVYGTNRSHTETWIENHQGPVWKLLT